VTRKLVEGDPLRHLSNQNYITLWTSRMWGVSADHFTARDRHFQTMVIHANRWEMKMSRKTYRIELKIDFTDDSIHEVMLGIAKQYARDLLASSMLLQDGRKPAAVLFTDDSFHGIDEIDIMPESETLHTA